MGNTTLALTRSDPFTFCRIRAAFTFFLRIISHENPSVREDLARDERCSTRWDKPCQPAIELNNGGRLFTRLTAGKRRPRRRHRSLSRKVQEEVSMWMEGTALLRRSGAADAPRGHHDFHPIRRGSGSLGE